MICSFFEKLFTVYSRLPTTCESGNDANLSRCNFSFLKNLEREDRDVHAPIWSVYIIRCGDGSLYTGIATDVDRRFSEHEAQGPKTAKYLRGRLPLKIVYRKEIGNRSEASKEELRIKRMGVKGKLVLLYSQS